MMMMLLMSILLAHLLFLLLLLILHDHGGCLLVSKFLARMAVEDLVLQHFLRYAALRTVHYICSRIYTSVIILILNDLVAIASRVIVILTVILWIVLPVDSDAAVGVFLLVVSAISLILLFLFFILSLV
jgi:hypothetical protein